MTLLRHYLRKNLWLTIALAVSGIAGWSMLTGTNIFVQQLVDLIVAGDRDGFMTAFIQGAVFVVAAAVVYFASRVVNEKFGTTVQKDVRDDMYNAVMGRNRPDFNKTDTAEYISAASNDVSSFSHIIHNSVYLFSGMAGALSAFVIMVFYNLPLTMVAAACSVLAVVLPIAFSKAMQRRQVAEMQANAGYTVEMKEIFSGHEVISSFGLRGGFRKRFGKKNAELTDAQYKIQVMREAISSTGQMLTYASRFIMILIAGYMVMQSYITLGVFTLFVSLQATLTSNIVMVFQIFPYISAMKPVAEKLEGYMNYKDDAFSGTKQVTFNKQIDVCNVSFHYNEDAPVLRDISLTIEKNKKIALTGPSGCGKTTLIKLLSGDYANYSGEILYDGASQHTLDIGQLRRLITVIHQNTYIFNDTIRANILLGEDFPQADLNNALRLSGVEKFLPTISGGPDAPCGEKGVNLSGGQKQRIAIARALVRGATFLVLDEGVSAVDVETANEIEQELLNIPGLTLLTVTHRIKDGLLEKYDEVVQM